MPLLGSTGTQVSVGGSAVAEGHAGAGTLSFAVERTGDATRELILEVRTINGTATAPADYVALPETRVSVPAGDDYTDVTITVNGDAEVEADEDFFLRILSATLVAPPPAIGPTAYFEPGDGLNSLLLGYGPYSVAIGDVNNDGKQDLAVANVVADDVAVLLNTSAAGASTPTFATAESFASGDGPNSVAFGDVNGDGKRDLLVANGNGKSLAVLLNSTATGAATASFSSAKILAADPPAYFVVAGDINLDGRVDVVAARSAAVSVWLNTTPAGSGSPSFAGPNDFSHDGGFYHLALADLNGDGRPDLLATGLLDHVAVLLNTTSPGATTPSFASALDLAVGLEPKHLAIADFNADGKPDLAVANSESDDVSVLLNRAAVGGTGLTFTTATNFAAPDGPYSLAATDLNADGRPDLVVGSMAGEVATLRNASALGATAPVFDLPGVATVGGWIQSIALADLNGDGRLDLVAANDGDKSDGNDNVAVLLNATPSPTVSPDFLRSADFGVGVRPVAVTTADINGDGKPDLLSANAAEDTVSVLLNDTPAGSASGSFQAAQPHAVGAAPAAIGVGDFNADGRPDFVTADLDTGDVSVRLNTTGLGASSTTFATASTFAIGDGPGSLAIGDLNGDGRQDLVVANRFDNNAVVLFNATAPGATAASLATAGSFALGATPRSVLIGDINSDGKPDVAAANHASGNISVLVNATAPGSGTASFTANLLSVGGDPDGLAGADVNGDGRIDLVAADSTAGRVSVFPNLTSPGASIPAFGPPAQVNIGWQPAAIALRDLTGDGRPDLGVLSGDGSLRTFRNTTAPGASTPSFTAVASVAVGATAGALEIRDVNSDGHGDIVVVDSTNDRAIVLTNGLFVARLLVEQGRAVIVDDDADRQPEPFAFVDQMAVAPNAAVVSNPITVSGINAPAEIAVNGGEYSVDGGGFTSEPATVNNGQVVRVQHQSASTPNSVTDTTLTVGGISDTFSSRTGASSEPPAPDSRGGGGVLLPSTAVALLVVMLAGRVRRLRPARPND